MDFSSPLAVSFRVLVFVLGATLSTSTFVSAIKLVVVPKGTSQRITRFVFVVLRRVMRHFTRPSLPWTTRDQRLAFYAPFALILLPFVWMTLIILGFAGMHWALDPRPIGDAFSVSGSSMLTLGVLFRKNGPAAFLSFLQAGLGLIVGALLVSYLPTIYSAYSRREVLVGLLESRAGMPPSPVEMLIRYQRIGAFDRIEEFFERWEDWFVEIEEGHTNFAALNFFRSPRPDRSWVTAAGCVLDSAALYLSVLEVRRSSTGPGAPAASLCVRAGYLSLRRIADYFLIPYNDSPRPSDPISVSRAEFDFMWSELSAAGLPMRGDRDQAWRDFQGWRVNYDTVLVRLATLVQAPPAAWSSDRIVGEPFVPALLRSRKRMREHTQVMEGLRSRAIEPVAAGTAPETLMESRSDNVR